MQAYLNRVVNGGGRIEREYGLGRGRTDLLVLWPREAGQPSDLWERFVVECKVLRDSDRKGLAGTVERGVEQTLGYMAKCGAEEGHLVVIDRRTGAEERRAARAGRVEAVAGRTDAAWWSGRCRALTGEYGTTRKTGCSGKPPSETGCLALPPRIPVKVLIGRSGNSNGGGVTSVSDRSG